MFTHTQVNSYNSEAGLDITAERTGMGNGTVNLLIWVLKSSK